MHKVVFCAILGSWAKAQEKHGLSYARWISAIFSDFIVGKKNNECILNVFWSPSNDTICNVHVTKHRKRKVVIDIWIWRSYRIAYRIALPHTVSKSTKEVLGDQSKTRIQVGQTISLHIFTTIQSSQNRWSMLGKFEQYVLGLKTSIRRKLLKVISLRETAIRINITEYYFHSQFGLKWLATHSW